VEIPTDGEEITPKISEREPINPTPCLPILPYSPLISPVLGVLLPSPMWFAIQWNGVSRYPTEIMKLNSLMETMISQLDMPLSLIPVSLSKENY